MIRKLHDDDPDLIFRSKLGEEEAAPPTFVWSNIEKELDRSSPRSGYWKWWLSGFVLLIGVSVSVFMLHGNEPSATRNKQLLAEVSAQPPQDGVSIPNPASNSIPASNGNKIPGNNTDYTLNNNPGVADQANQNSSASDNIPLSQDGNSGQADHGYQPSSEPANPKHLPKARNANPNKSSNTSTQAGPHHKGARIRNNLESMNNDPELNSSGTGAQLEDINDVQRIIDLEPPSFLDSKDDYLELKDVRETAALLALIENESLNIPRELPGPGPVYGGVARFYVGVHGGLESRAITGYDYNENGFDRHDVKLYRAEDSLPQLTSMNYNYGGRLGWFPARHFSVNAGIWFNTMSMHTAGTFFQYYRFENEEFRIHTATSTVTLNTSVFAYPDYYGIHQDSALVKVMSDESYSFFNLDLGGAWYPIRGRWCSAYINAFATGLILNHSSVTLTSVHSGKAWQYSGDDVIGMNHFTMSGQIGAGFEFTPVERIGIWVEPSCLLTSAINKNNAYVMRTSSVRFQAGLNLHF